MASALVFERQYRTSTSEGYRVLEDGARLAQVELHYANTVVYCTLILFRELAEHEHFAVIEEIDDRLVLSAEVPREDLMVTVYHGNEVGFYNDDMFSHARAEEDRQITPSEVGEPDSYRN
jgi:hypothetical protein